jgi:hypothetical protein
VLADAAGRRDVSNRAYQTNFKKAADRPIVA